MTSHVCLSILAAILSAAPGLPRADEPQPISRINPRQPDLQPGPAEPDWHAILDAHFGLALWSDLLNPVQDDPLAVPGLFRKAGPGPVTCTPILALGLEVPIACAYYLDREPGRSHPLWTYRDKHSPQDLEASPVRPVQLAPGSTTEFDPGDAPFGLVIFNDQFKDSVFTQPSRVKAENPRLAAQPYKVMIYPVIDRNTGNRIPHQYLIGWEYSTNDDFQDVVTRLENVELIPAAR
jgi:hypothetical protein